MFIVISAASGTGKTTLIKKVLRMDDGIQMSVSHTTRPPRRGETNGKDYYFVSGSEFKSKIKRSEFLEWEEVYDHLYGTSKEELERCKDLDSDVVFDVDVKGALNIKKKFPKSILIFIAPPSWEELKRRLVNRATESKDMIKKRLKRSQFELGAKKKFDYVVVNSEIEKAYGEIRRIIEAGRGRGSKG